MSVGRPTFRPAPTALGMAHRVDGLRRLLAGLAAGGVGLVPHGALVAGLSEL